MKTWIYLSVTLAAANCFAGEMGEIVSNGVPNGGAFVGLGANYNLIDVNQYSWGRGITNVFLDSSLLSYGVAQGTGAPFHATVTRFSPEIQAGYFKNANDKIYGVKFAYQYLGLTATNSNLYIPQTGQITTVSPPSTSALFGYVNADSIQVTNNSQMTLLGFIGKTLQNKYIYLGAGPALFNVQSHNYYSIGYAEFNGATVDVTGLVSYSSPTIWEWGGAVQMGMTYFFDSTWFIDASYTYAMSGQYTVDHSQPFTNSFTQNASTYTTTGAIFTQDKLKVSNQAIAVTINKLFDV